MKTIKIIFILTLSLFTSVCFSQSIGIAPIKTFGVYATPETAATIARLELVKLEKYQVLDRFDMYEIENIDSFQTCYGKSCLIEYGKLLHVDYLLSGSIDGLGSKIVITLKLIDVKGERIIKTQTAEFNNQEVEIQRMMGIVIQEMHDIVPDPILKKQLIYNNEVITSNSIGRVNNAGPRMGLAYTVGTVYEFVTRDELYGGLGIAPVVSNIGYQFEGQYVGTENFSAIFECLVNFTGLEQGQFIPSVSFLNGFRFGRQGWEFAFGPSFGVSKSSVGFFTTNANLLGDTEAHYWSQSEFENSTYAETPIESYGYEFARHGDARGRLDLNTRWLMGFGRTFQSGALNIPVNIYYSSQKGGGMAGVSIGFNITKKKTTIN